MGILKEQVDEELLEAEDDINTVTGMGFSARFLERLARDGLDDTAVELPVDVLSLSSLLSQGFEECPARQALRLHGNDTQAALDWLVRGAPEDGVASASARAAMLHARAAGRSRRARKLEKHRKVLDSERQGIGGIDDAMPKPLELGV